MEAYVIRWHDFGISSVSHWIISCVEQKYIGNMEQSLQEQEKVQV